MTTVTGPAFNRTANVDARRVQSSPMTETPMMFDAETTTTTRATTTTTSGCGPHLMTGASNPPNVYANDRTETAARP